MDLSGKNIVITGAASGIGRAMARRFHAEGAGRLYLTDVNEAGLTAVAKEVGACTLTVMLGILAAGGIVTSTKRLSRVASSH